MTQYDIPAIRKFLVAGIGAVVALLAHYDVIVNDPTGDVVLVLDSIITPILVFLARND